MMMSNLHIHPKVWRFLGFVSSVVGFMCYAFSPSFHDMFGHWTLIKIFFYSILSSIFSVLTLFTNKCPKFSRGFLLKAHVGFLVLIFTSLYSFYEDRSQQHDGGEEDHKVQRRNVLSLVSFAAFAFMSVSLSKQIQPKFDVGLSNFFLGCLIVTVMKMNIKIVLGVLALIYVLLITVRAIMHMVRINEMHTLADHNNGDEQGDIEMPSLNNEGHEESMNIWFQAFKGSRGDDEHRIPIMDATSFLA